MEKVDGTWLTGVDYKTQGLSAIKDKPVLEVIMMESRRLNVTWAYMDSMDVRAVCHIKKKNIWRRPST